MGLPLTLPLGQGPTPLLYGAEPGLRFACVLDGRGGCRELSWTEVQRWRPDDGGVLWIHLEREAEACHGWLRERSGIDPVMIDALLADEARPRVDDAEDALLVILRGVNRHDRENPEDLVPLRMWIDRHRVISLRDKDHFLMALREIRESLTRGRGPVGPGDLFALIADKIVRHLEPVLEDLEDEVDQLADRIDKEHGRDVRVRLAETRSHAIQLRRYLAPQREALFRLQVEDASWLGKRDKVRLREVTDKMLRFLEDLDAIRDRTTILHEDLSALVAEEISRTSNRLTAVAALLLPPSLFAGLLGMNLEGIPWHDEPWAFFAVCGAIGMMFPLEFWLLRRMRWI
jgi:zinc transporter